MSESQPTLSVSVDCPLVRAETPSQRALEWAVRVPRPAVSADRPPLNLALVIDRSGSMAGQKLPRVIEAACHLIDRLEERDRVALVAYDHEVQILSPSRPADAAHREEAKARVRELSARGTTDLGAGWLQGAAQVAEALAPDALGRVLLLTDGLANQGITSVEELTRHARELRQRGISTSTFGVGLDFNEELLEAMALEGGGHFFYIDRSQDIPGAIAQELGELLSAVAREATLRLSIPQATTVTLLGDLPHEKQGDHLSCFIGDLYGGQERLFYTQVLTPPAEAGSQLTLSGELTYTDLDNRFQTLRAEATLTYRTTAEVEQAPRDTALLGRCERVDLFAVSSRAVAMERRGLREEAANLLHRKLMSAAPALEDADVAEFEEITRQLAVGMTEADRKHTRYRSYRTRQTRPDPED